MEIIILTICSAIFCGTIGIFIYLKNIQANLNNQIAEKFSKIENKLDTIASFNSKKFSEIYNEVIDGRNKIYSEIKNVGDMIDLRVNNLTVFSMKELAKNSVELKELSDKNHLDLLEKFDSVILKLEENELRYDFIPYNCLFTQKTSIEDENGEIVGELSAGSFRTIVWEEDGKGELLSGEGFVSLDNIVKNPIRNFNEYPAKNSDECELKNGPSIGYHTIGMLRKGTNFNVVNDFGNWIKIEGKDISGWILKDMVK